jgi:hypothetical protein
LGSAGSGAGRCDDAGALLRADDVHDAIGGEEVVREAEGDAADGVEAGELLGGEGDASAAEGVKDLGDLTGADEGDVAIAAGLDPGGGDLSGGDAELIGDGVDGAGDGEGVLGGAAAVGVALFAERVFIAAAGVLAGEDAAAEGCPGEEGEVEVFGHGEQIALGGAF